MFAKAPRLLVALVLTTLATRLVLTLLGLGNTLAWLAVVGLLAWLSWRALTGARSSARVLSAIYYTFGAFGLVALPAALRLSLPAILAVLWSILAAVTAWHLTSSSAAKSFYASGATQPSAPPHLQR